MSPLAFIMGQRHPHPGLSWEIVNLLGPQADEIPMGLPGRKAVQGQNLQHRL